MTINQREQLINNIPLCHIAIKTFCLFLYPISNCLNEEFFNFLRNVFICDVLYFTAVWGPLTMHLYYNSLDIIQWPYDIDLDVLTLPSLFSDGASLFALERFLIICHHFMSYLHWKLSFAFLKHSDESSDCVTLSLSNIPSLPCNSECLFVH